MGLMLRIASSLSAALLALDIYSTAVLAGDEVAGRIAAFENGLHPATIILGAPEVKWTVQERMAFWHIPGLSVAVIRNGQIAWAKGYGVKQVGANEPVDTESVFSAGSVSKMAAAIVSLRLVMEGKLALDADVNNYLHRWKVPANDFTRAQSVTLRGLMSHTGGFNVWGFPDFQPHEKLPTLIETLDGLLPEKTAPIRVEYVPGAQSRYSGGGVTVEQLVIEDVTGVSFPDAARKYLLNPLVMTRSTFENPLPERHGNIAKAHNAKGEPAALPRGFETMPETAASGLWTTPTDYAKVIIAIMAAWRGEANGIIDHSLAEEMMTEVGPGVSGLGAFLDGHGLTRRFSHSGANDSYKAWFEGHLATGDGVVIMTNGASEGDLRTEVRRAVALAEGWAPAFQETVHVPAVHVSQADIAANAGSYGLDIGSDTATRRAVFQVLLAGYLSDYEHLSFKVSAENGRLSLSSPNNPRPFKLIAEDRTHFLIENRPEIRIEFVRSYKGTVDELMIKTTDSVLTAKRVQP